MIYENKVRDDKKHNKIQVLSLTFLVSFSGRVLVLKFVIRTQCNSSRYRLSHVFDACYRPLRSLQNHTV